MLFRASSATEALSCYRQSAVANQLKLLARLMTAHAGSGGSSPPHPEPTGKQQPSAATHITATATAAAASAAGSPVHPSATTSSSSSSSRPPAPPPGSVPPSHHVTKRSWSLFGTSPRFLNPWPTGGQDKPLSDVMKFGREMRAVKAGPWGFLKGNLTPTPEDFRRAFPNHPLTPDSTAPAAPGGVAAVWLGHASVLVNMEGWTFITDPVFSERCSPVQFLGPRRVVPNLFHPEDPAAPHLDAVLISHNHYDHLDTASVKRLHKRYGAALRWYVPLGLASWFRATGITNLVELDWWQGSTHPGTRVEVTLTPSQHWSSRSGMDRRATLWGGWAVKGPSSSFWFAGDTGYCPVFKEIGARLGPFDLAAIPIGAYEPRWFMAPQHIGPEEAVQVAQDVRARHSLAIHCCTFYLTTEPLDEPPALLRTAVAAAGLAPEAFIALQHGARMEVAGGRLLNQPLQLPVL